MSGSGKAQSKIRAAMVWTLAVATVGIIGSTSGVRTTGANPIVDASLGGQIQEGVYFEPLAFVTSPVPTHTPTGSLPRNGQALLLLAIAGQGQVSGAFLNPYSGDFRASPSGYVPISWSPSGERILLVDTSRNAYYVGGAIGENPRVVLHAGYRNPDLVGWWLGDRELLLPLHAPSAGQIGYSWYLVDTVEGTVRRAGALPREPSVIYAASPDGAYWVENDTHGVSVVWRDGHRFPLWPEGEVGVERIPFPPRLAILPDASAVLFPGCTGTWAAQSLTCEVLSADLRRQELVSYNSVYRIGSHSGVMSLDVSPDGRRLAFYSYPDGAVIVVDLASREAIRTIDLSGATEDATIAWSPDAHMLAVSKIVALGSEVLLIDITSGEVSSIPIPTGYVTVLDWQNLPPR